MPVDEKRITSWDVARLAGVSRSTVSQVLNGNHERFPQETRDRVAQAAETLSYRPSRAGRSLVTGLSDLIVVVVPNVTFGRHLQDAVDSIAASTAATGMSVVVRYAGTDTSATLTTVLDLRPAMVLDLGVFEQEQRNAIAAAGIRVTPNERALAEMVEDPNHYIGRLQARHLLETSGRRLAVALLVDDRVDVFGPSRRQGVIDEALAAGAPDPIVVSVPLDLDGAVDALSSVLASAGGDPLGFCCYNDDVAIAVLGAARRLGLRVPEDVAVVGVDRTAVGQLVEPRLTSVAFDLPRMFTEIASHLIGQDADLPQVLREADTFVELVVGESS